MRKKIVYSLKEWLGIKRVWFYDEPLAVNEAVNFEKKAIFIAVPKTGTTTVRRQLAGVGQPIVPNSHLNIMQVKSLLYTYLLMEHLGENKGFPNANQVDDAQIKEQANALFSSFFKFSAVRNPWARTVSLYFRREGTQVKEKLSFEAFCEQHIYASDTCLHPTLHRNQLDWLCDENGAMLMDYVYKVEDLKKAIQEIAELTDGRIRLTYNEANKNPASLSADYRSVYTEKTKAIVAQRFEKDIDYFKYVF